MVEVKGTSNVIEGHLLYCVLLGLSGRRESLFFFPFLMPSLRTDTRAKPRRCTVFLLKTKLLENFQIEQLKLVFPTESSIRKQNERHTIFSGKSRQRKIMLGLLGLYWEEAEHKERLRPLPDSFSLSPWRFLHTQYVSTDKFASPAEFLLQLICYLAVLREPALSPCLYQLIFALSARVSRTGARCWRDANCCPELDPSTLSCSPALRPAT